MLEPCLRSTVPFVDEVIMTEGLIEGVDPQGLPEHGDISWLAEPSSWLPERIHISSHEASQMMTPWSSIAAACNWILHKAQALEIDWLLLIDADQELHSGERLRDWLAAIPDNYAAPFRRSEQNGIQAAAPWQLVNPRLIRRYVAGCYIVETIDGHTRSLVPPGEIPLWPAGQAPWTSHHPERRPPWRRGNRLGAVEALTDRQTVEGLQPFALCSILAPVSETATETTAGDAGLPAWYCPGCGTRYQAAGTCANGHPPLELLLDPEMDASGAGGTADAEPTDAAPQTAAEPEATPADLTAPDSPQETVAEPPPEPPVEPTVSTDDEPAVAAADTPTEPEPVAEPVAGVEPTRLEQIKNLLSQAGDLLAQL